jgi:hypothetical protein
MSALMAFGQFIWKGMHILFLAWRRVLCLVLPLAAVYVVVGSFFYGEWWFGFFFRSKIYSAVYWRDACLFLLNEHFYWTLALLIAISLTVFATVMAWRKLVVVLDKHYVPILFASAVVLLVNNSFLYKLKKDSYIRSNSKYWWRSSFIRLMQCWTHPMEKSTALTTSSMWTASV